MLLWILLAASLSLGVGVLIGWALTLRTRRRLKHSLTFFKALNAQVPSGLFYQDFYDKNLTFASHALALLFGLKQPISWVQVLATFEEESARILDTAYQTLFKTGTGFYLFLSTPNNQRTFCVTGTLVQAPKHHGALIAFQEITDISQKVHVSSLMEQHKNILANALDALSFPMFIRDTKGLSIFANAAVNQEKADTLNDLSWLSVPFKSGGAFYTLTYGQETKTEEELQQILANMLEAQRRLCAQLPCAVCLLNAAGQLMACSEAFMTLWQLDKGWLKSMPSYEDYWDTVQDNGLLSRVADFADYKKQQRESFARLSTVTQLFLYLPDGRIIRRTMIPYVQGGVILLDENQEG